MTTATSSVTGSLSVVELLSSSPDFVVEQGIPRQKAVFTSSQGQTADSFGFKWAKRDTYESDAAMAMQRDWVLGRYQLSDHEILEMIQGRKFLDAGCGAGQGALLAFHQKLNHCRYIGVDISDAVDVAKARFNERGIQAEFVQASLMELPLELGNFDFIFSEGVLHHTDSTEKAINSLSKRLNPGGLFMFYVYGVKAPMREYADDYIREKIAGMSNEQAWKALEPLTKLGIALGELNVEIDVPETVDLLGIPAGKMDLQRFFYWHFCKAFYRSDWTLDEMNHVNFDWYRPTNCHRQTPEQVRAWVTQNGLEIVKWDTREEGISVIARKP
jgi:arsenite methyltransferase